MSDTVIDHTFILDGVEYGQAADIAQALTSPERPITAARIRDWGRRAANPRDRLYGLLPHHHHDGPGRGTTWYRLDQAAQVERLTRHPAGATVA